MLVEMLAFVMALWSLLSIKEKVQSEDQDFLIQPHPAQIIGIFRIFGIGDSEEKLENNLVQIGTVEGKSLRLAAVSIIFGFNVSCASYSQYLSERDFKAFEQMFDYLKIKEYINYGTFNKLCEGFINREGDLRKIIKDLFLTGKNTDKLNIQSNRPEILLIDEVDVFFSTNFYGMLYTPSASIKNESLDNLFNFIWSKSKETSVTMQMVLSSSEYKECVKKFKKWEKLIEEVVKDMIYDGC